MRPRLDYCLDDRPRPSRKLPSFSFEPWHAIAIIEGVQGRSRTNAYLYLAFWASVIPRHLAPSSLPTSPKVNLGFAATILGRSALQNFSRPGRAWACQPSRPSPSWGLAGFLVIFLVALGAAFLVGVFLGGMVDVAGGCLRVQAREEGARDARQFNEHTRASATPLSKW